MKTRQWTLGFILLIVFVVLGGFRDILFVNINEQIDFNDGLIETYRVLDQFQFLNEHDTPSLVKGKWILTIAFSAVYLLLSIITFSYVLIDRQGVKWLCIFYIGAFVTSGITYLAGKLLGDPQLGYTLSRVLMGALQSPFPLMLMIPARMLSNR